MPLSQFLNRSIRKSRRQNKWYSKFYIASFTLQEPIKKTNDVPVTMPVLMMH